MSKEEDFKDWMEPMEFLLEEFTDDLPDEVGGKLDYSIESLDVLEGWLLDKYASYDEMRNDPNIATWDAANRYFGQVLVKHVGGEWKLDPDTGRPNVQLGHGHWIEPALYVNGTVTERKGNALSTFAEKNRKYLEKRKQKS